MSIGITRLAICSLAYATYIAMLGCPTALSDEVATFSRIQPSLGLVIARSGRGTTVGTAFCVETRAGLGFLLTNRHVVGNDASPQVVMMSSPTVPLPSKVVRLAAIDAAVLAIPTSCEPLQIASSTPSVGTRIGIAGFPAFQITLFNRHLGLAPSFHEGTISSIVLDGGYLQYDAQTDHGNSGSPLFDIDSGEVYGLVQLVSTGTTGALQNNLAIGKPALAPFLSNVEHQIDVALSQQVPRSALASPPRRRTYPIAATPSPEPTRTQVNATSERPATSSPSTSSEARGISSGTFVPVEGLAWRPPHDPSTAGEQRCVDAFAAMDSNAMATACSDPQSDWANRRVAASDGSAAFYETEFTAAYYTAYFAQGLSMLHDPRARQYASLARDWFLDVGSHSVEYGYWARLATVYLKGVFVAAGIE